MFYVFKDTGSTDELACLTQRGTFFSIIKNETVTCGDKGLVGVVCQEVGMNTTTLELYGGYWRSSLESENIIACKEAKYCVGGNVADKDEFGVTLFESRAYCAKGHKGPHCQVGFCLFALFRQGNQ